MGVMMRLEEACKAYGPKVLFEDIDLQLTDDMKVGVVGPNGAGKSTLCRVLLEQEELDLGKVVKHQDLRLAYLQQHDPFHAGESVCDFLMRESDQPDWRCAEVAARFALNDRLDDPVTELSGGYQTRVKLCGMLLQDPNFIILDEPTNFLDLRTQLLLERFLDDYRGGSLVVSHDRTFLKRTCDHTLAIVGGKAELLPGDVDEFDRIKAEQRDHAERAQASIDAKKKQLERFVIVNRANANTASQARSKAKQLERMEDVTIDEVVVRKAKVRVPDVAPRRGLACRCESLSIGYPDHTVAAGIDLQIDHGQRAVIVGDNGQGKTTLLRTLAGDLERKAGDVQWASGCEIAVYSQFIYRSIANDGTVAGYLARQALPGTTDQEIRDVAGSFLFSGDDYDKPIAVCSGGERARLCLAGILLGKPTVLLMDEPTNHLDADTVDALATALASYNGTAIIVSHDRAFCDRVANLIWEVQGGGVRHFPGAFADYLHRIEREMRGGGGPGTASHTAPEDADARKQRNRRLHELGKLVTSWERKIGKLQQRLANQEAALLEIDPSDHQALADGDARVNVLRTELDEAETALLEAMEEQEALAQ